MRILALIMCLVVPFVSQAIDIHELLGNVKNQHDKQEVIGYSCRYQLFKGHNSKDIHTTYQGYTYKKGDETYQKINESEIIHGKDFFLKINHTEKAMVLGKVQRENTMDTDLESIVKECKSVEVVEDNGVYLAIFHISPISELPYSRIELRVNQGDFEINQLDFFYAIQQDFAKDFGDTDYAQPHLRIKYNKVNVTRKDQKGLLDFSEYIVSINNFLKPSDKLEGYQMIDNRLN